MVPSDNSTLINFIAKQGVTKYNLSVQTQFCGLDLWSWHDYSGMPYSLNYESYIQSLFHVPLGFPQCVLFILTFSLGVFCVNVCVSHSLVWQTSFLFGFQFFSYGDECYQSRFKESLPICLPFNLGFSYLYHSLFKWVLFINHSGMVPSALALTRVTNLAISSVLSDHPSTMIRHFSSQYQHTSSFCMNFICLCVSVQYLTSCIAYFLIYTIHLTSLFMYQNHSSCFCL